MSKDKYKVGYGKPPKSTRFKKGKSGNPKGRPKNSNNGMTLLKKRLSEKIIVSEGGRTREISKLDALVMQTINAALKGNLKATSMIFDMMDRKGLMDNIDMDKILPGDHAEILNAFVERKQKEIRAKKKLLKKKKRKD